MTQAPPRKLAEHAPALPPLADIDLLPPIRELAALADLPFPAIDIWTCNYHDIVDPGLIAEFHALLTEEERARHDRLVFERHRLQFLATRALCRWALSQYAPVPPEAWRFSIDAHGKPSVAAPAAWAGLRFNLSNTDGLVACAVGADVESLGVDVEKIDRKTEILELAEHSFAASEARILRALPAARQRERFFSYWTLKESYIKARGLGLKIPLRQFAFDLDEPGSVAIRFGAGIMDDPRAWSFALLRAGPEHLLAVGAKTSEATPPRLRASLCLPLRGAVE